MNDSLTEYMYCSKHGGFGFSKEFEDEYEKRYGKVIVGRADPDAIALFKERGQDGTCKTFWGKRVCTISLAKVPTMYLEYIDIHEYDGLEYLRINHDAYLINKLKRTDPTDVGAITELIREACAGPVHPGENMG